MMRSIKLLLFVLILAEAVSAQIVLTPKVSGTCKNMSSFWSVFYPTWQGSGWIFDQGAFAFAVKEGKSWDRYAYQYAYYCWYTSFNGIFEFDIENTMSGAPFPPHWMTSNGWTAQMEDIEVIEANHTPSWEQRPGVDLFNLADGSQDGDISTSDCNTGTFITTLSITSPPVGSIFAADVTEALRHDLFGPIRYPTSGFVLKARGLKKVKSVLEWSDNAKITITFLSETPTPGPSPTPQPSSTPSPTTPTEPPSTPTPEVPCDTLRVRIRMPSTHFSPGNPCSCHLVVCNPGPEIYTDIPLIVVLDVFGTYFFWPDFTSYDNSILATVLTTVPPGPTIIQVLPTFTWPEGAGTATDGVQWIAGMTNPDMTTILGDYGTWEFGWGP